MIGVIVVERFCLRKSVCLLFTISSGMETISCKIDKGNRVKHCQILLCGACLVFDMNQCQP